VIIDIDLIQYDGRILRPEDYEKNYVQQLLPTLPTLPTLNATAPIVEPDIIVADTDAMMEENA
jgi:2-amino-4-hydroxy-6-hydroxymethyldihydropteridine diphosphokinase